MIVNEKNRSRKLKNNILSLGQKAKKAKKENPNTINATVGMLSDENNILYTFKSVTQAISELSMDKIFAYGDTGGSSKFKQAIKTWVFDETLPLYENHHIEVVATPGGSGAIAVTFANYLNPGDKVLLPDIMWETYITFAKTRDCDYMTYQLFNEAGRFNLNSIKHCIDELIDQETVVLVVNDPCQNPTGFCMNDEEYDQLVRLLNSYDRNIVLFMDVAYFDYYSSNRSKVRNRFAKLVSLKDNILTIFGFSGSKTFGLYGLRIGAAIAVSKDKEEIDYFKNVAEFTSRGTWSSSSTLGCSLIEKLVLDEKYNEMFKNELKNICETLEERANIFIEESRKCNLELAPFERGFFVCVPTSNPVGLMEALYQDNCFVIVTKTCIRVALCSINIDEARRLPRIIKNRINSL